MSTKRITQSTVLLTLLFFTLVPGENVSSANTDGGWSSQGVEGYLSTDECSVDRVSLSAFEDYWFAAFYLEQKPVIIVGTENEDMRLITQKGRVLEEFGNITVTLSAANTISHRKTPMLLREYIQTMHPQRLDQMGNETFYMFGPDKELAEALSPLIAKYEPPPFSGSDLAYSFGIGASGSGVPFHIHGHGFSEVLHGKKRWFLYPPNHKPPFDPDASSAYWLKNVYPNLKGDDLALLQECVIGPGEVLYFPSLWWHATINLGESVFMSSFDADQAPNVNQGRHSRQGLVEKWWRGSLGLPKEL